MVVFYLPGNIPIYAFSLLIAAGAFFGLAWIAWQAPEKEMLRRVDAGLCALLGGLLGGRGAYVAVNWGYYQERPWESLQLFQGGMAWPGALAGGLFALWLFSLFFRLDFGELADALAPLLLCLAVSACLGCWLDGCAYGPTTSAGWGLPARDEWGQTALRWPLQAAGALASLALFWLLDCFAARRALRPGVHTGLALLGFSTLMAGISWLRADPGALWRGCRLDVWVALSFAVLSAASLLTCLVAGRRAQAANQKNDD
ncbi:MAG: prolipoprotein diacylglyceryl transferase [Anaerolineales bacterium]|nr:prolipoprotein diacylglyceryl transferase [Anaerolineales bacterium]